MGQPAPPLRDLLSTPRCSPLKGWVNSIPTMKLKSIGTMSILWISPWMAGRNAFVSYGSNPALREPQEATI